MKITPNHPLFLNGEWRSAGEAQIGNEVLRSDGTRGAISSIEFHVGAYTVYNFTVDHTHVYFAKDVLGHNVNPGDGGADDFLSGPKVFNTAK